MAEFRQQRRATTDYDEKADIRQDMLEEREEHRKEVKSLLTNEQKAYFDRKYKNNRRYESRRSENCNNQKGMRNGRNRGQGRNW